MCGRYTLTQPKKLKKRFETSNDIKDNEPRFNVAPAQYLPTITRNSPNKITMMKWGFIPHWSKDRKFSLINIRSETVGNKPYFNRILTKNRCLIPGDGFFEWKRVKVDGKEEKIPFYIHMKNKGIFSFAGIFSSISDAEGKEINTFAILTTKPNSIVKKIHNRMPVILEEKYENTWLNRKTDEKTLHTLLRPFPSKDMVYYKVSSRVNRPQNDGPSIIQQI